MNDRAPPLPVTVSIHADFIKARLPQWAASANPALLKALRTSLRRGNQSRHDLKALLAQIQNPMSFVKPVFKEEVRLRFWGLLDADNTLLVRPWRHEHLLGLFSTHAQTTEHSLLEAALQNFELSEAQDNGMTAGSGLFVPTRSGRVQAQFTPIFFAAFCRDLNLGSRYQRHLNDFFDPPAQSDEVHAAPSPRQVMRAYEKNSFESALHIAHLKGEIDADLYQQLLALELNGEQPNLLCNHLTIDGVTLPDVLVIRDRLIDKSQILYTPHDPFVQFRRHESMDLLKSELSQRLLNPYYLKFFERFVPQRYRRQLITITAPQLDILPGGRSNGLIPARVNIEINRQPISGDLFEAIAEQRIVHIKNDARALVVPTADADLRSREARLHRYKEMGASLLFFAASFLPVVGEVLLAVTGAQLINSVYKGFSAWSRGDSDQALDDLMDVVDTAALGAVTAGAIKTAGFTAKLVAVKLNTQAWRLWNPDLTPYRIVQALPDGLPANSQGVYEHNQSHYVKLDEGAFYQVKQDSRTRQWHVQHPDDPTGYSPALFSNGAGAWRHEHETVKDWDDLKLLHRLGPDASTLKESAVEPLLQIGDVDVHLLREIHQDGLRPPPQLRDALKHFNFEQEINDFNLSRAEGTTVTTHSPFIQFHLLCSLPEWPLNTALNIVDDQQHTLLSSGAGGTEIKISETQFRKGQLLQALEQQLPVSAYEEMAQAASIPEGAVPYFSRVTRLASLLSDEALEHKQRLFNWLCEYNDEPLGAIENQLNDIAPQLTKSQREELTLVLSGEDRSRLLREKSLSALKRWEVSRYLQQSETLRHREGLYLDSVYTPVSLNMTLLSVEQLPGWPASHRIEVRDQGLTGPVLGTAGLKSTETLHILIREGELYALYTPAGVRLKEPTDLFSALEYTLTDTQRKAIFDRTNAPSLKPAVRRHSLSGLARPAPFARGVRVNAKPATDSLQPLDPLFAQAQPPARLTPRKDGIHEALPIEGGTYRYYVLQEGRYYQIKRDRLGWQLIDARSPFRAYKPYVVRNAQNQWLIDTNAGVLRGGMPDSPPQPKSVETPVEQGSTSKTPYSEDSPESAESGLTSMVSAEEPPASQPSSGSYQTGEDISRPAPYTQGEIEQMHSGASYQYSQNYRRQYDRANNGRYPLRDTDGQPLRIKFIQAVGKSHTSETTVNKYLVLPFIKWQSYEQVARLYDEKMEVVTFTAAHQKFPEEASLIGESTVISRKAIRKGDVLGVYGGELLPTPVATVRKDPYLMNVQPKNTPKSDATEHPTMMTRDVMLSGDNITSRINTIFEYEDGRPVRQAKAGYNVEGAPFDVDVQKGNEPWKRMSLCILFASEHINAGDELRWNYSYPESHVRKLFGAPATSSTSTTPQT